MGLFAGAAQAFADPMLQLLSQQRTRQWNIQDALAQFALQSIFDPETPPELRAQLGSLLKGTPYEAFGQVQIPETPDLRLKRELGPLLQGAQALGALGQLGLLTPDLAGRIESLLGRGEILPRREVQVPVSGAGTPTGPPRRAFEDIAGAPPPTYTQPRREIDISRLQPPQPKPITIKLFSGEEVPIDAIKGLSGDLQMYLIQGPEQRVAQTYGQLFGESLKPDWRSVPVQFDSNGSLRFPPEHAFVAPPREPTPTEQIAVQRFEIQRRAHAEYARVLKATGDPIRAWKAASAIDSVTYKPELISPTQAIAIQQRQQRLAAIEAFNRASGSLQQRYNAAFALDPTFPAPATMQRPTTARPKTPGAAVDQVTLRQSEKAYADLQAKVAGVRKLLEEARRKNLGPDDIVGDRFVGDVESELAQLEAELQTRKEQLDALRATGRGEKTYDTRGSGRLTSSQIQTIIRNMLAAGKSRAEIRAALIANGIPPQNFGY